MTDVAIPGALIAQIERLVQSLGEVKEDGSALRICRETKTIPLWLPNGEDIMELKQLAAVLNVDELTAAYCALDSANSPRLLRFKADRFVRTAAGAVHFGQPIGSRIERDGAGWRGMLLSTTAHGEGITLRTHDGSSPIRKGYVVALSEGLVLDDQEFFSNKKTGVEKMMKFLRENQSRFDDPRAHIGIWHDKDNNEVAIDVSYLIDNREDAVKLGVAEDQQAIWDVANAEAIDTGGTGQRETSKKESEHGRRIGEATEAGVEDERRRIGRVVFKRHRRDSEIEVKDVIPGSWSGNPTGGVPSLIERLKPVSRAKRDRKKVRIIMARNTTST